MIRKVFHVPRLLRALLFAVSLMLPLAGHAAIALADAPLFSTVSVPGNLALALSVEYPTAISPAYPGTTDYASTSTYYGYFDPAKCYLYKYNSTTPAESYFTPYSTASSHTCTTSATVPLWSGNYLNWSSMMSLDGFRWVLTGGTRGTGSSDDTATTTILEKTYVSSQGTHSTNTPEKTLSSTYSAGATPFNWSTGVKTRNWGGRHRDVGDWQRHAEQRFDSRFDGLQRAIRPDQQLKLILDMQRQELHFVEFKLLRRCERQHHLQALYPCEGV
jgi:hypothetical protein